MPVFEAAAVATVTAVILYVVDRGIAWHVCLFAAIGAGGRFETEEAYGSMDNPFRRWPRIALGAVIIVATFVLALRGGIPQREEFVVVPLVAAVLAYVTVSWVYAARAFRRTPQSIIMTDAVNKGEWPKQD